MDLLKDLNSQQQHAVTAPPGPILVLAGPGSGKTRVLTQRIAYLIQQFGARPEEMLAVTFTNKAAREMSSRLRDLLGGLEAGAAGGSLGTFHALCARILRREADRLPGPRDFAIFDDAAQQSLVRQALKELNLDPRQNPGASIQAAISSAKNELILPTEYGASTYFAEVVRRVYVAYQNHLTANNALDFDDLLLWAVRLLREHDDLRGKYRLRYPHILVDEFQDTNTAQYVLLRLLAGEQPDLFVVGDPDQSIYGWRGADYRNVKRFQGEHPQAPTIL